MDEDEQLRWFGSETVSVENKYLAWKAIDMLFRYTQQDRCFDHAKREKKKIFGE